MTPTPDIPALVERLREAMAAATPGPWDADTSREYSSHARVNSAEKLICSVGNGENPDVAFDEWSDNARFIAAARNDLPALIDALTYQAERIAVLEIKATEAEIMRAKAIANAQERNALEGALMAERKGLVSAWEALPGGRQVDVRDVERWLANEMALVVNRARAALAGAGDSAPPDEVDTCPVCAEPLKTGDTCATDIELGICNAACLEGSPTVDINTGEPVEGPVRTYPYGDTDPATPSLKGCNHG